MPMLNALASIRSILETSGYPDGETGMTFPYGAVHCYGKDTVLTPGTEETFAYLGIDGGRITLQSGEIECSPGQYFLSSSIKGVAARLVAISSLSRGEDTIRALKHAKPLRRSHVCGSEAAKMDLLSLIVM